MNPRQQLRNMPIAERIAAAKAKTERLVRHVLYVLELHENNRIVFYSPTLASQIPTSHAANAFVVFQHGLYQFEIVRLCALWDSAEPEKENIPTVMSNPSDDPSIHAIEVEAIRRSDHEFGEQQAQQTRNELRKCIDDSRAILASPKHASIMNLRDKHIAHALTETRRERRVGFVDPMKYGDEKDMLDTSLSIVQRLFSGVNGTSFDFDASRKIDRKNAEALWSACKFDIKR
jgi:hypothetical protein